MSVVVLISGLRLLTTPVLLSPSSDLILCPLLNTACVGFTQVENPGAELGIDEVGRDPEVGIHPGVDPGVDPRVDPVGVDPKEDSDTGEAHICVFEEVDG